MSIHSFPVHQKRRDIAGNGEPPDNGVMEARVAKLEDFARETGSRLVRIETAMATKTDISDVRNDIQKGINETQRWMIATVIGLFVGFGGLFLAMSNALKPAPSALSVQPPIIINVPAQAPVQAPTARK